MYIQNYVGSSLSTTTKALYEVQYANTCTSVYAYNVHVHANSKTLLYGEKIVALKPCWKTKNKGRGSSETSNKSIILRLYGLICDTIQITSLLKFNFLLRF